jgi:hypothetical protein
MATKLLRSVDVARCQVSRAMELLDLALKLIGGVERRMTVFVARLKTDVLWERGRIVELYRL